MRGPLSAALALVLAVPAAAAVELRCRVLSLHDPEQAPDSQRPGHVREAAGLTCGGRASEFCSDLRRAFVLKTPPTVRVSDMAAACRERAAAEHWTGVWQGVTALQRGHNYSAAERRAAEEAFATVRAALFRAASREAFRELDALREYYLNKAFVVSPAEDGRIRGLAEEALAAFEARLPDVRAGRLSERDWEHWNVLESLVERYYITPGSALPEQEALLRRFDALAAFMDVHGLLRRAGQDEAARARYAREGELTAEGRAVSERARAGRLRLRSFGLEHVAANLAAAPRPQDGGEAALADDARARLDASARRAAAALQDERAAEALRHLDEDRPRGAAPPKPPRELLEDRPSDIPEYLARLDPAYVAFLMRLEQTEEYGRYRSGLRSQHPLERRLMASELAYAEVLARRACGGDRACARRRIEEMRPRARAVIRGETGDFRWLTLQAVQRINQRENLRFVTEVGKALLPGYACYELYDRWSVSTRGQKAGETLGCGLGMVPVVSALARASRLMRAARAAPGASPELAAAERAAAERAAAERAPAGAPAARPGAARRSMLDDVYGLSDAQAEALNALTARSQGLRSFRQPYSDFMLADARAWADEAAALMRSMGVRTDYAVRTFVVDGAAVQMPALRVVAADSRTPLGRVLNSHGTGAMGRDMAHVSGPLAGKARPIEVYIAPALEGNGLWLEAEVAVVLSGERGLAALWRRDAGGTLLHELGHARRSADRLAVSRMTPTGDAVDLGRRDVTYSGFFTFSAPADGLGAYARGFHLEEMLTFGRDVTRYHGAMRRELRLSGEARRAGDLEAVAQRELQALQAQREVLWRARQLRELSSRSEAELMAMLDAARASSAGNGAISIRYAFDPVEKIGRAYFTRGGHEYAVIPLHRIANGMDLQRHAHLDLRLRLEALRAESRLRLCQAHAALTAVMPEGQRPAPDARCAR